MSAGDARSNEGCDVCLCVCVCVSVLKLPPVYLSEPNQSVLASNQGVKSADGCRSFHSGFMIQAGSFPTNTTGMHAFTSIAGSFTIVAISAASQGDYFHSASATLAVGTACELLAATYLPV